MGVHEGIQLVLGNAVRFQHFYARLTRDQYAADRISHLPIGVTVNLLRTDIFEEAHHTVEALHGDKPGLFGQHDALRKPTIAVRAQHRANLTAKATKDLYCLAVFFYDRSDVSRQIGIVRDKLHAARLTKAAIGIHILPLAQKSCKTEYLHVVSLCKGDKKALWCNRQSN